MTGVPAVLPQWLRTIFLAVAEAPWTNIKQLNAMIMDWATAAFLAVSAMLGYKLEEAVLYAWLAFLAGLNGFAMIAAGWKRETFKSSPPNKPDVEDAAAGATTSEDMPAPRGGVAPGDAGVRTTLEQYAATQRASGKLIEPVPGQGD